MPFLPEKITSGWNQKRMKMREIYHSAEHYHYALPQHYDLYRLNVFFPLFHTWLIMIKLIRLQCAFGSNNFLFILCRNSDVFEECHSSSLAIGSKWKQLELHEYCWIWLKVCHQWINELWFKSFTDIPHQRVFVHLSFIPNVSPEKSSAFDPDYEHYCFGTQKTWFRSSRCEELSNNLKPFFHAKGRGKNRCAVAVRLFCPQWSSSFLNCNLDSQDITLQSLHCFVHVIIIQGTPEAHLLKFITLATCPSSVRYVWIMELPDRPNVDLN